MKLRVVLLVLCFVFFAGQVCVFAHGTLGAQLKGSEPVMAYVGNFDNKAGQQTVTSEAFKKNLAEALRGRKSLRFELVDDPAKSLIQISGTIQKYQYLDKGPIKVTPSAGMMALDMVQTATGNYVEMETDFIVIDTKSGKVLWKGLISTYLKKPMTPGESVPLISEKVIKTFMTNCFGKPK